MSSGETTALRDRISYQAMLLGGFSLVATALLVVGYLATRDDIALRLKEDMQASLGQVVPARLYDNDILANPLVVEDADGVPVTVYRGAKGAKVSALAREIVGQGYAGDIRLLLGLDINGEILGVRVIAHAETPGLGDKIEVNRNDWILGFDGLSLANTAPAQWAVDKDGGRFDAFSGATITPRAVVAAIKGGLETFAAQRDALTASAVITTETSH
jgi:electron transport complex protein RnfG